MGWTSSRSRAPTRVVELRDGELDTYDVTPEEVGLEPRRRRRRRRRHARAERARAARRCSPASPGTERSLAVLNAGAAIYVGGGADIARGRACARPSAPIDSGAARERARALRGGGAARMSVRLDELVERDARRRSPPQARAPARPSSSAEVETRPRGPAVRGGAVASRHVADRRAQAPLAVGGRRSARARAVTEIVQRLRARRRGGDLGPHRGGALRRLARGPARGARAPPSCRSCARTSRSTRTSSTRRRSPARTPCCWWSARSSRATLGALLRARRSDARPRRDRRDPRRGGARARARARRPT